MPCNESIGVVDPPGVRPFDLVAPFAVGLGLAALQFPSAAAADGGRAGVLFVDVGQGSALVALGPDGRVVAVDSGPAGGAESLLAALDRMAIRTVDLWIHTHHDADHNGGVARVLRGRDGVAGTDDDVAVGAAWDRGDRARPSGAAMSAYLEAVGPVRVPVGPGATWGGTGVSVTVLSAGADHASGSATENRRGLAVCLEVAGLRVFVPGDRPAEDLRAAAAQCPDVDVLWVAHHGARDGTDPALLEELDPRWSVVSAGRDNGHCHPHPGVVALLAGSGLFVLDGAGLAPTGPCDPLATSLGPDHTYVGGDVWIGASPGTGRSAGPAWIHR